MATTSERPTAETQTVDSKTAAYHLKEKPLGGQDRNPASVKETGEKTYMKMGTAGVGFGLGANKYQVIFFFQDSQTYDNFVNKGWQADAGATASAGENAAEVKTGFVNGIAIYQMTEKGLMANADIAGTKYWKNDKLN